jgi:hypothetical protein
MRNCHLLIFFGLATTVAVYAPLPVQAEPKVYQEVSGTESLRFDPEGLAVLESLGLSFAFAENTATPAPGFPIAADLLPPSSDPSVRGTSFTFSYDDETNVYIPLGGTEEFTGSIFFNVDTTKLNLDPQLEIGDLSVSFNPNFEFSITDTANTGLPVFDVESSGIPNVDLDSQTWTLEGLDLIASQEFSDFLVAAGASQPIVGLKIAEARGDRGFIEVDATEVPEPSSAIAILTAISATFVVGKRRRST